MKEKILSIVPLMVAMLLVATFAVEISPVTARPAPANITRSRGRVGVPYTAFVRTDARPPYTWSVVYGRLPPGIRFNNHTGEVSGTPTTPGKFTFAIGARGPHIRGISGTTVNIIIDPPIILTITRGIVGNHFSDFARTGGARPPYRWSWKGRLPPGITLNPHTGQLRGRPTTPGNFTFTISVKGPRIGMILRRTVTIRIVGPPITTNITRNITVPANITRNITVPANITRNITVPGRPASPWDVLRRHQLR